jgi:hypothetical protein
MSIGISKIEIEYEYLKRVLEPDKIGEMKSCMESAQYPDYFMLSFQKEIGIRSTLGIVLPQRFHRFGSAEWDQLKSAMREISNSRCQLPAQWAPIIIEQSPFRDACMSVSSRWHYN